MICHIVGRFAVIKLAGVKTEVLLFITVLNAIFGPLVSMCFKVYEVNAKFLIKTIKIFAQ